MLSQTKHGNNYFILGLIGICTLYLLFEFFLNSYVSLSVDEFWFAHRIYQYKNGLPYRDFAPYKTVMGYYLLLIPMLLSHGVFSTLIFTKNVIALFNACMLLGSALWLSRFFSRAAILISLCLLVSAELVLSYSTNIRVDLLGYWFCFFSLLLLLEKRYLAAGLLLGLGFITTQKVLWYIFASNFALGIYWIVANRNIKTIWHIIQFNFMIALIIGIYIAFWSWMVNWNTVIHSVFYEAAAMYHLNWYNSTRALFWSNIILYNPLLFLLWPLTLVSILVTYDNDRSYTPRLIVVTYSFAILAFLIPYKQVFPYYMQVTIPLFFALYAAFFTWLLQIFKSNAIKIIVGKTCLWIFLLIYILTIIFVCSAFQLPKPYLLICLTPMLLGTYITNHDKLAHDLVTLFFNLIAISIIFVGGVYSLTLFTIKIIKLNGAYQKANIDAMNSLLQDGSDYVAGIELIYNKTQPIAGMRHLMGPAVDYLYSPTEELREVMLASLYEDPNATSANIIQALKQSSVKFYVNNYRIEALPPNIKNYLASEYEHFWGSIYLYAPQVDAGQRDINVKFSGNYLVESRFIDHINLDCERHDVHSQIYLQKGTYLSNAKAPYRLKLIPTQLGFTFDPRFQRDESDKLLWSVS